MAFVGRKSNRFGLTLVSNTAISAAQGPAVTPGNNAYGAYTTIMTTTEDAFEVWINFNSNAVSAAGRDTLCTVGIDPAGGTAFVDTIVDLLASAATVFAGAAAGSIWYRFPLFVPKNATIGVKASVNNVTVGTLNCYMRLSCLPSRADLLSFGTRVVTFGSTPASSSGTAMTPGNGIKGAYVQLGTAVVSTDRLWFWQLGIGINQSNQNNNALFCDLAIGNAGNKLIVIADQLEQPNANEGLTALRFGAGADAAPGDLIYARAMCAGSVVAGWSAAAYAMAG